jgi:hypothetical protein
MPEEDPESCVDEDASCGLNFMCTILSTPLKPGIRWALAPRIELARLTVPQYQNAVADLLGLLDACDLEVKGTQGSFFEGF